MTLDDVKKMVKELEDIYKGGDHEASHGTEDYLRYEVLKAIANGECEDPQACAKEAIRTEDFDFERWCA